MKFRKLAPLGLAAAMSAGLMLTGCSSQGQEKKTFTIAYAPNESTEQSVDARQGLAKDLQEVLGMEVKEIQASDYNAIIEALRTGKAVYRSVLIARSDNTGINSIADIRGKTMAFVDPDSTSGNLIPTAEIINAFPDDKLDSDLLHTNGAFFEAVSFSGKHQAGLQAVIKGDVDVASQSDIKVIFESGDIPAEAMVVGKGVDSALREKLVGFLTGYQNEEYFTKVIKVEGARFVECGVQDYQSIIELNDIINAQ